MSLHQLVLTFLAVAALSIASHFYTAMWSPQKSSRSSRPSRRPIRREHRFALRIGKKVAFVFLLSFFAASPALANDSIGGSDGAGGDDLGIEFTQSFRQAVADVQASQNRRFGPVLHLDPDRLVADTTVLLVEEDLNVNAYGRSQKSVAASRREDRVILVNRARWAALVTLAEGDAEAARKKNAVALHEFLVIEGIEDTGKYPYSTLYRDGYVEGAVRTRVFWGHAGASNSQSNGFLERLFEPKQRPAREVALEAAELSALQKCQAFAASSGLEPARCEKVLSQIYDEEWEPGIHLNSVYYKAKALYLISLE